MSFWTCSWCYLWLIPCCCCSPGNISAPSRTQSWDCSTGSCWGDDTSAETSKPCLGEPKPHVEITASTREAEEPSGSSPCKNFCSSCGEFSALGCLLIPHLPLHRAAGGLWEKVPVTAPAVPGFLSQRGHDMNKDTGLTRNEKKLQRFLLASTTCYSLYLKPEAHSWVAFSCFLGSMCREQLSHTPTPAVIHALWFSLTQGVRLALGSAITAWLCPAPLTLTGSKPPALPLLIKGRTSNPGLCSEQSQNRCLRAESSQPLQRLSHWHAVFDLQLKISNTNTFRTKRNPQEQQKYFIFSNPKIWLQLQNCSSGSWHTSLCLSKIPTTLNPLFLTPAHARVTQFEFSNWICSNDFLICVEQARRGCVINK